METKIWTLVNGAWGDTFACYGNICKLLEQRNLQKANVVYYGLDNEIVNFLKNQDKIDKVRILSISDPELFFKYAGLAASDFPAWMQITGLNKQIPDLIPTHISRYYNIENPTQCNRTFKIQLPTAKNNWVNFYESCGPYILFQPFSCHSCTFDKHWPYWMECLEWSLEKTNKKIVLVGQLTSGSDHRFKFPWIEHPNLINLVGQTDSMIDVFHLMNNCDFCVTTTNALSMYSIIINKPSLVVCNQIIKERSLYYYNWIHHLPNSILEADASVREFKDCFRSFDVELDRAEQIPCHLDSQNPVIVPTNHVGTNKL